MAGINLDDPISSAGSTDGEAGIVQSPAIIEPTAAENFDLGSALILAMVLIVGAVWLLRALLRTTGRSDAGGGSPDGMGGDFDGGGGGD